MVDFQGDFDPFAKAFPTDLVPSVFRMLLQEWPNSPRPVGVPLENRITNRFVGHLQNAMREYDRPLFKFTCRPKLPDPESDSETGEVDISIDSFSPHQDAFLIIECKRLNVEKAGRLASLAGEYVGAGGMGCFLSGQYQSGTECGGMLGYVMSRTVDDAIASIDRQLAKKYEELLLLEPHALRPSEIVPNETAIRQSTHALADTAFEIVHLFLKY